MVVYVEINGKIYETEGCRELSGITDIYKDDEYIHYLLEENIIKIFPVSIGKYDYFEMMEKAGIIDIITYNNETLVFKFIFKKHLRKIIKYMINIIRYDDIYNFMLEKLMDEDIDDYDTTTITWKEGEKDTISTRIRVYLIERYFTLKIMQGINPFVIFNDEYKEHPNYFSYKSFNESINFNNVMKEIKEYGDWLYNLVNKVNDINYIISTEEEW